MRSKELDHQGKASSFASLILLFLKFLYPYYDKEKDEEVIENFTKLFCKNEQQEEQGPCGPIKGQAHEENVDGDHIKDHTPSIY